MKWLTPVKPEKNACPASALFQCSLIRSDAADAAAAGHKTTQRRRRPPVRRRRALVSASNISEAAPVSESRYMRASDYKFSFPAENEFSRWRDLL